MNHKKTHGNEIGNTGHERRRSQRGVSVIFNLELVGRCMGSTIHVFGSSN